MLQTIGVDAICLITQYLSSHDLRPITQLSRFYAQLLQQRHQAYYHPPLPSFHREEFNLNTYRKWLNERSFLVITSPEQLLAYSRSRIMTHATDIELRLDTYCHFPTSPPATVPTPGWFTNPSKHLNAALEKCLIDIRTTISRFQHVRSLRLWYRPTSIAPRRKIKCSCTPGWITFENWFMQISYLCLEIWSPKLISFELEIDPSYPCGPYALGAKIPRMPTLQHLSLLVPSNTVSPLEDLIPESLTGFQFSSKETSVLIFDGGKPITSGTLRRTCTNASQVIWIHSTQVSVKCDVYQYLAETHQLRTDESVVQPSPFHHHPYKSSRPIVPFQLHQLRTFTIDPGNWPPTMNLSERIARMEAELVWMVDHFTRGLDSTHHLTSPGPSSSSLESLVLFDALDTHDDYALLRPTAAGPTPINYASYLDRLRHQLRMCTFYTSGLSFTRSEATTGPFHGFGCNGCQVYPIPDQVWTCTVCTNFDFCQQCHQQETVVEAHPHDRTHPMTQVHERYIPTSGAPTLPISLIPKDVVDASTIKQLQWTQLECLALRLGPWEMTLLPQDGSTITPMAGETWLALERTLPALESLGLSLGLLPLGVEPLSGILLRIKHLSLFDHNFNLVPATIDLTTYCDYISSVLTIIVTQLRQLESLDLYSTYGTSDLWTEKSFMDCLSPLVLSSANLRRVSMETLLIQEYELNEFERKWQMTLFHFYAIWTMLQPSFEPPLNYTSIRTFFYPLIPPRLHPQYDMLFVTVKHQSKRPLNQSRAKSDQPQSSSVVPSTSSSSWPSWWKKSHTSSVEQTEAHEQEIKRLQLLHQRSNAFQDILTRLRTRATQLFQQHPHLTPQPRTFNLELVFESEMLAFPLSLM